MDVPYYKIQPRDLLYISVKTQTPEGSLEEVLIGRSASSSSYLMQSDFFKPDINNIIIC